MEKIQGEATSPCICVNPIYKHWKGYGREMMKRAIALVMTLLLMISATACGLDDSGKNKEEMTGQKEVARITRYASEIPEDYSWFDYGAAALSYDRLVFGGQAEGAYFPLMWQDETYDTFGFAAYVGDNRTGTDGGQEAVATVASILSATLMGIDKSNQEGVNYVEQLHAYFSEEEGVVLNNPGGKSAGLSMWYVLYPTILFVEVSIHYPQEIQIREDSLQAIESWYKAYQVMEETGRFDYTGFDFTSMQPYENDIWKEPDSAAGIAVLLYHGYEMTGKQEYIEAVLNCLDYVDKFDGSSLYEILLYFAPALAAKMNAQYGQDYDIDDLLGDVLNGSSIPRGGWGSIVGTWGDYCMNGLMGSTTDGGGYAFSMNTFAGGYALAALAKYDTRYAKAMGIWFMNAASAGRYFFPGETAEENQSSAGNADTLEFVKISGHAIPYEGIRKSSNSKSPWVGGDPTVYGWGLTDLSLYSGAHTGMFAAAVEQTDVDCILKINCNVAEVLEQNYNVFLLYNPYGQEQNVVYELPEGSWNLFDSVSKQCIAEAVAGSVVLTLQPKEAAVIVEIPSGEEIVHENGQYMVNGTWIASDTVTVGILGIENNDSVKGKVTLDVQVVCTDTQNALEDIVLEIDGKETIYHAGDNITFQTGDYTSGSKNVNVTVRMSDGKTDKTSIRLNFKE